MTRARDIGRKRRNRPRQKLKEQRGCIGCGVFYFTENQSDACSRCRLEALRDLDMKAMLQQRRGLICGMKNARDRELIEEAALRMFPHHGKPESTLLDENGREVTTADYLTKLYAARPRETQ